MRRPYSGNYSITSNFGNRQFYLNGQLITDFHNGIDIGGVFDVLAAESGTVTAAFTGGRVDANPNANTPANYVIIDHGNGLKTYYWHLSSVNVSVGQKVSKGQKLGVSGRTGYATGNHLHFAVLKNGAYQNPRDYVDFSKDSDSNLPVNNNNMGDEFITVGNGWGLSNVAAAAGLPINEDTYRQIYNLNQGHRGSWDWQSLNARMGAGDTLRVRPAATPAPTPTPTPAPNNDAKIKELQTQIDALTKTVADTKEEKRKELEALSIQLQKAKEDYEALEDTSIKLSNDGFTNQLATHLTTGIIEEAKARGIKEKWASWVDSHFSSNFMRQLLKYTWPAWVFFAITTGLLAAAAYGGDNPILVGIIPGFLIVGAAIIQFLLTNYDKNKDGKVDFNDFTDELKG